MAWQGPTFSSQTNTKIFLTACFGEPADSFFLNNPTFPFACMSLKLNMKNMFVSSTKRLALVGHRSLPAPITTIIEGIAEKMYAVVKFTESLEIQATINEEDRVTAITLRGPDSEEFVPVTWDEMESYSKEFGFPITRRYSDDSWEAYLQTWNYSHLDAVVQWEEGFPVLLTLDALATLAVAGASTAELTEASKVHERLRWCFTYMCMNHIPRVDILEKVTLTKLEKLIFAQITNFQGGKNA